MHRNRHLLAVVVLAAMILALAGCSKVTAENYAKIEMGMEYKDVVAILGTPSEAKDAMGTKSCVWGKDGKTISIKFVADKVVFHSAKGLK